MHHQFKWTSRFKLEIKEIDYCNIEKFLSLLNREEDTFKFRIEDSNGQKKNLKLVERVKLITVVDHILEKVYRFKNAFAF